MREVRDEGTRNRSDVGGIAFALRACMRGSLLRLSLLACSLVACTDAASIDESAREWPCRSSDGQFTTHYEYDAALNIVHEVKRQIDTDAVVRELTATFAGDVRTSLQEDVRAHMVTPSTTVSPYDMSESVELDGAGRPMRTNFRISYATTDAHYIETYTYQEARLVEAQRDWSGTAQGISLEDRTTIRTFTYPSATIEVEAVCDFGGPQPGCVKYTRAGGRAWTTLSIDRNADGSAEHRIDRELDANGLVVAEEITELPEQAITARTITTRRPYGAPVQTINTWPARSELVQTIDFAYCGD